MAIVKEQKELREELVKALNTGFAGITTMLAASANDTRKAQAQAQASSGQDPLLSEQIYWLALDQAVAPTNEPALKLNFVGIGFEAYFNPLFPSFFKCTYTDAKKNKVGARGNALPRRTRPAHVAWAAHPWRGVLRQCMTGHVRVGLRHTCCDAGCC